MVLTDTAPGFLEQKKMEQGLTSGISFFYDSFYARLFDVHPGSKTLFTGIKSHIIQ
jgi:hypothetical protein